MPSTIIDINAPGVEGKGAAALQEKKREHRGSRVGPRCRCCASAAAARCSTSPRTGAWWAARRAAAAEPPTGRRRRHREHRPTPRGLGKEVGPGAEVTILISSTTRAQLPVEFTMAAVGSHLVKCRSERIDVQQLLGPEAEAYQIRRSDRLRGTSFGYISWNRLLTLAADKTPLTRR